MIVVIMIDLFVHDDSLTRKRFTTRTVQLTKCCEPLQKMRVRLGSGLSPRCEVTFGSNTYRIVMSGDCLQVLEVADDKTDEICTHLNRTFKCRP